MEAAKKMGADVVINSKEDPDGLEREVAKLNRGGLRLFSRQLAQEDR